MACEGQETSNDTVGPPDPSAELGFPARGIDRRKERFHGDLGPSFREVGADRGNCRARRDDGAMEIGDFTAILSVTRERERGLV